MGASSTFVMVEKKSRSYAEARMWEAVVLQSRVLRLKVGSSPQFSISGRRDHTEYISANRLLVSF